MRYIKTYEEKKKKEVKYPYSLFQRHGSIKGVSFKGLTDAEKKNEIEKFKILQEYFGIDAVSGTIEKYRWGHITYELDFGYNVYGGMSVVFNISGDYYNNEWSGRIVVGYDRENDQFLGDGEGEELEFPLDYYNIENLRTSIERVIEWCRDPESYEAFKNAGKYNL